MMRIRAVVGNIAASITYISNPGYISSLALKAFFCKRQTWFGPVAMLIGIACFAALNDRASGGEWGRSHDPHVR